MPPSQPHGNSTPDAAAPFSAPDAPVAGVAPIAADAASRATVAPAAGEACRASAAALQATPCSASAAAFQAAPRSTPAAATSAVSCGMSAVAAPAVSRLPPLEASRAVPSGGEAALAAKAEARALRDAQVRGVASMQGMRDAIRAASRALPAIDAVPRVRPMSAAAFRARARQGLPFIVPGAVARWPICALQPSVLREHYGEVHVRARVGDYIGTAFAPDRAMQDMTMRAYLDLADASEGLPPYAGNLELRELNRLCHWPTYFEKMGPPRFWIGPAGTVTPLHCDFDDNIFAQIWGRKRIFLAPPHHDEFLYTREANPVLFGSPFDPEAPDYERYPLALQAALVEVLVEPGDMLYVPAGWYHQVRALTFSLSSNRWARGRPLLLEAK